MFLGGMTKAAEIVTELSNDMTRPAIVRPPLKLLRHATLNREPFLVARNFSLRRYVKLLSFVGSQDIGT